MIDLQIRREVIIYSIAITFSISLWAFFLNASSVTIQSLVSFARLGENIANITSINFILFLLLFPITYALMIVLCRRGKKRAVQLTSLTSVAVGCLISLIAFSNMINYIMLGVFYFASVFLVIEIAYMRFAELERLIIFRTTADSTSKAILVLGTGLFIVSCLTIFPNQEAYSNEFEDMMLSSIGAGLGTEDYAGMSADLLISAQKQQLNSIMQGSKYQKIKNKDDEDVQGFVSMMDSLKGRLNSAGYREELIGQITEQQAGTDGETMDIMGMMKQQSPILGLTEQFFWLIESFFLMSMLFLIGKIILGPLAVIYGIVLDRVVPKSGKIE